MSSAIFNLANELALEQGSTYELSMTITKKGVPWNLTGYALVMQFKKDYDAETSYLTLTNAPEGGLALSGTDMNVVNITILPAQVALIPVLFTGVYDLMYRAPFTPPPVGGKPKRLVTGNYEVRQGVTKVWPT